MGPGLVLTTDANDVSTQYSSGLFLILLKIRFEVNGFQSFPTTVRVYALFTCLEEKRGTGWNGVRKSTDEQPEPPVTRVGCRFYALASMLTERHTIEHKLCSMQIIIDLFDICNSVWVFSFAS